MALLVLAYPEISESDYERIQAFRRRHDVLYYRVVDPHFTLVFPVPDLPVKPFIAEVANQAQGFRSFEFCIRCAVLNKDAFSDDYFAFLVPDEGYGRIVRLHDRLYADKLFPWRALMVDYIPHIGIGNSKDPLQCLEMVHVWNREEFGIPGRVVALDIANYEHGSVETIERILLAD